MLINSCWLSNTRASCECDVTMYQDKPVVNEKEPIDGYFHNYLLLDSSKSLAKYLTGDQEIFTPYEPCYVLYILVYWDSTAH